MVVKNFNNLKILGGQSKVEFNLGDLYFFSIFFIIIFFINKNNIFYKKIFKILNFIYYLFSYRAGMIKELVSFANSEELE